jgi:hypothetical protein
MSFILISLSFTSLAETRIADLNIYSYLKTVLQMLKLHANTKTISI